MLPIAVPTVENLEIDFAELATITLKGTLTSEDPARDLGAFFKKIHEGAIAEKIPTVTVDVSALSFVNSASIRLFIDWTIWAKSATAHRYTLRIVTSRKYTWQRASFAALKSLARDVLQVEQID
jgi:hypothetical protein